MTGQRMPTSPFSEHPSYWITSTEEAAPPRLEGDADAEVLVVGAGIAGLSTAYFLAKAGRQVLVLDRHGLSLRDTGNTTAHLSNVLIEPRVEAVVEKHGAETAKAILESNAFGIDLIERIAHEEGIECDFARVPGIFYGPRSEDQEYLRHYAEAVRSLGFPVEEIAPDEVPFPCEAALRFPNLARFHPRKFLLGLARRIEELGARVRLGDAHHVKKAHDGRVQVVLKGERQVRADSLVQATHMPFYPQDQVWARLHPHRSYVVGAWVRKGAVPDALMWDTLEPYHYTRIQPGREKDLVIFGGEDQAVGHGGNVEERWQSLEGTLQRDLRVDASLDFAFRWSAQDPTAPDGISVIGLDTHSEVPTYVATAFHGWGMSHGALAGYMISEQIQGRPTPWDALYAPQRLGASGVGEQVTKDDKRMKHHMEEQRKKAKSPVGLAQLRPGEATLLHLDDNVVGVARARDGSLHAVSAKCQHMGCLVAWNNAEDSWDCPCHGSRYSIKGDLLEGPAPHPLEKVDLARVEAVLQRTEQERRAGAREQR